MLFTMNTKARPDDHRTAFSFRMACLLAVLMTAAVGCASAPLYRTHPELQQRKGAIRTVGLLPPTITMYEEQYRFKLIPHDEWAPEAAEAVRKAFIDEMAAIRVPLVVISGEDRELNDIAGLFSAVDFSITRHVYGITGRADTFPEKVRYFDYSLGPVQEMMERHSVDALWFVSGFNLFPTKGTQAADTAGVLLEILSGMGGHPVPALRLRKIELRAALVDKSGTIFFYCKLGEENVPLVGQSTDQAAEEAPLKKDFRDARTARQYIRALLTEYRKAVAQ